MKAIIHTKHKTIHRKICALVLILTLMLGHTGISLAGPAPELLNDRAADIIASAPLLAPGLLNPTGLSGQGQIIGLADSGLDRGSLSDIHPDLQSEEGQMPRVAMLKSYSGRDIPDDPVGHGTHMAATIVGSGQASDGKYRGIAPGASLYFQALLDKNGSLAVPQNLSELFWPAYSAGVRVHINGWGGGPNAYSGNSAAIDDFVYRYPDFLPVFGAGNGGPAAGSLSGEANSKNALTVGNSQLPRPAFSPEALDADLIAASSSRGPAVGGRIKPELLAPGSAVISACSRLLDSNFAANPAYSLLGGSSMAAAVTGGALALLSEYLEKQRAIPEPSASLLKALLINGCRTPAPFPSREQGFGILDLAGTILALQEGSFLLREDSVNREEWREYKLEIKDSQADFKATLAWTDPPGQVGSSAVLRNDLDLLLIAPGGKSYYGNDFSRRGQADNSNNVEQVIISNPLPGEYTLRVSGGSFHKDHPSQSFALVYGQSLRREIVRESASEGEVRLESGNTFELSSRQINPVENGEIAPGSLAVGSDLYLGPVSAYSFSRIWGSGGVQVLPWHDGRLLLEINAQVREGGYFLDARADSNKESFYINDNPLSEWEQMPAGVEINARLNPSRQTLWQFKAAYHRVNGFIERIDLDKRELKLLRDSAIYKLASWAAVSFDDKLQDCGSLAAAFGSGESGSPEKLSPGMKVELLQAPGSGEIQHIQVERRIIMGKIAAWEKETGELSLESGKSYVLFPGAQLLKDNEPVGPNEIASGDTIMALLLGDGEQIIQLHSISRIQYGQVAYYNRKTQDLYYYDSKQQFTMAKLSPASEVYRYGILVEPGALEPGAWIRLISSADGGNLQRIDIARAEVEGEKIFSCYIPAERKLLMSDGSSYIVDSTTRISKGLYAVAPELLLPGERVRLTTLAAPAPWAEALMRVEVTEGYDGPPPELQANAYNLNGVLIVKGSSSADEVLLIRQNRQEEIEVSADSSFSRIFPLEEGENELRLLAVDSRDQGIKAINIIIQAYPTPLVEPRFSDISGNPAQKEIEELARRGIVSGYPDGSFRPNEPVSRAEFAAMLARSRGWTIDGLEELRYFSDNEHIPWWAMGAVYAGRERGYLRGYPDGSFAPWRKLSIAEAAALLLPLLPEVETDGDKQGKGKDDQAPRTLPYRDSRDIAAWAYPALLRLYQEGMLPFAAGPYLRADRPLTRGEAAILLGKVTRAPLFDVDQR